MLNIKNIMLAFLSPNQLVLSAVSKKEWPMKKVFLHGMVIENSSIPISIKKNFRHGHIEENSQILIRHADMV